MNQITIQTQQHLLAKSQVSGESEKEVLNLLQKNRYTAEDLMGLSWVFFEEGH